MQNSSSGQPGIGQIYAAFDPDSMTLFEAAMSNSSGSVVTVADLRNALADNAAVFGWEQIPSNWQLGRGASNSGRGQSRPIANEPALRELLLAAYRLGAMRRPDSPVITPQHLWDAATESQAGSITARRGSFVEAGLGQSFATRNCDQLRGQFARQPVLTRQANNLSPRVSMDEILDGWLELQAIAAGPNFQRAREKLAQLTADFEKHIPI